MFPRVLEVTPPDSDVSLLVHLCFLFKHNQSLEQLPLWRGSVFARFIQVLLGCIHLLRGMHLNSTPVFRQEAVNPAWIAPFKGLKVKRGFKRRAFEM